MGDRIKTTRTVALLAAGAAVIGSLGPWVSTFLVDVAGTKGDGKFTLVLVLLAAAIAGLAQAGSGWMAIGGLLALASAVVAGADIATINSDKQELFGQEVSIVSPGWGIWLVVIASAVLAFALVTLWIARPEPRDEPAEEPASSEERTG